MGILRSLQPLLIFRYGEEIDSLLSFRYPHDGCHKLDKEIGNFEQRRVEMVQEVDKKALDMGAVVILHNLKVRLGFCERIGSDLISHNHQPTVSQTTDSRILLVML